MLPSLGLFIVTVGNTGSPAENTADRVVPADPEKTGSDKQSIVASASIINKVPEPDGIQLPENENPRTTPELAASVKPLLSASPPDAPDAQPSWLN